MRFWKEKQEIQGILSQERGYERKLWGEALTVCLAYPNHYRVGMSNLGFQTVYGIINRQDKTLCERVFLPDEAESDSFLPSGFPLLSLESQRPLKDFDLVAFSVSFEGDYLNILKILDLAGIPLERSERKEKEPLILGGGVALTLNPEPLSPFIDVFLIGEAEGLLPAFLETCRQMRDKFPRREILATLQRELAGVYVPACFRAQGEGASGRVVPVEGGFPERIRKQTAADLESFNTKPEIIAANTEFSGTYLIEVNRGCFRRCRFCAAGYLYQPARFRSLATLAAALEEGLAGQAKIGLVGTAVSDHPELPAICGYLLSRGGRMAIGSLRLDRMSEGILKMMKEGGVETVALAPEAGTERLRSLLNKGVSESHIMQAVKNLIACEIRKIRLYFLVGLPTETDEDIEGLILLVEKIKHEARKEARGAGGFQRITLSINQFIPKPVTPFQWCPLEDISVVKRRLARISRAFRRDQAVKVIYDLPKWNYIHCLLSLGDRRVGELILAAYRHRGNWSSALRESRLNPDYYVYRGKGLDEPLPWEIIDPGISREELVLEYKKALG